MKERIPMDPRCETCPFFQREEFLRGEYDYLVGLLGNPNTGKSTLFNYLTGLHQHVGNWPGKTVARKEGRMTYNGKRYLLVDLPGTYSLLSASPEEEIARDFLLFSRPDGVIVLMDATSLERNLNLTLQVLEVRGNVVVGINMMDEARRRGIEVKIPLLEEELKVPVIPLVARKGIGVEKLLSALEKTVQKKDKGPAREIPLPLPLRSAVEPLEEEIKKAFPYLPSPRWVALRILDGDSSILARIKDGTFHRLFGKEEQRDSPLKRKFPGETYGSSSSG
jgi:ferrous iron transport protein B